MGTSAPFHVQKIAIIGAGPSGLAAAKYFLAQAGAFPRIDVLEQQAEVGGVWNYSPVARPADGLAVPQTDAHPARPDPPVYAYAPADDGRQTVVPLFPSPMYDDLHTNIPHTLMRFSDRAFPDECEIFPPRQVVQAYLVEYARDVRHLIRFSTQVVDVALRQEPGHQQHQQRDQWDVRTLDLLTNLETVETYDAVVVASGHYSTPYIPDSAGGIAAFHAAHPGVVSHSKWYRDAAPFRGRKVVVVGTGASGLDIAAQIRRVCAPPLLLSAQTPAAPGVLEHISGGPGQGGSVVQVGRIKRFLVESRGVEFSVLDDEGKGEGEEGEARTRVETDVDAVLFCTGYLYTFPFLRSLTPPLITTGRRVHGLTRHLLHIAHPTLAFPGLPIKIIPFPLSEAQAAVLARLWSNDLPLPSRDVLEAWQQADAAAAVDDESKYHVFPKGGDGKYINGLYEWVVGGSQDLGKGKMPPHWDAQMLWQRTIFAEAKMQFEKTGRKARTLEELGFRYQPEEGVGRVEDTENVEGWEPRSYGSKRQNSGYKVSVGVKFL